MGRKLMRVPIDFQYPLNKVWSGYINPYPSTRCATCDGSGLNPATKRLSDDWYTHLRTDGQEGWSRHLEQDDVQALIDADQLWDFTRTPRTAEQAEIVKQKLADGGNSWLPQSNGYIPTAEEVNEWARSGLGHDAINRMICVEARAKRLGIYGECAVCDGAGEVWDCPETQQRHDAWTAYDPPTGDGYQLWETTSEGSPVSPVFSTIEVLCEWAAEHATTFGSHKADALQWRRMLDEKFVRHEEGRMMFC